MPYVEVKVFKDELDQKQSSELIKGITNVVAEVTSEKLVPATWVVIEEVNDGQWGVGGQSLSLNDVQNMMKE